MALLVLGLVLLIGAHLVPANRRLRAGLAAKLGENGYKGAFSLISLAGLVLIVIGYGQAPRDQIFQASETARLFLPVGMAIAFILMATAYVPGRLRRLLKHPMLAGVLIWSVLHLLANGDLASNVLFGSFAVWSVFAIISAARRGQRIGSARESAMADLGGVAAGLIVFAVVLYLHPFLFGVSPL
jgi:uncharacterized membrane protein